MKYFGGGQGRPPPLLHTSLPPRELLTQLLRKESTFGSGLESVKRLLEICYVLALHKAEGSKTGYVSLWPPSLHMVLALDGTLHRHRYGGREPLGTREGLG